MPTAIGRMYQYEGSPIRFITNPTKIIKTARNKPNDWLSFITKNINKMEKQTVFIKVKVKKKHVGNQLVCFDNDGDKYLGEIKNSSGHYCVKVGDSMSWPVIKSVLEEIELPSEEDIYNAPNWDSKLVSFLNGATYILNHLKSTDSSIHTQEKGRKNE